VGSRIPGNGGTLAPVYKFLPGIPFMVANRLDPVAFHDKQSGL